MRRFPSSRTNPSQRRSQQVHSNRHRIRRMGTMTMVITEAMTMVSPATVQRLKGHQPPRWEVHQDPRYQVEAGTTVRRHRPTRRPHQLPSIEPGAVRPAWSACRARPRRFIWWLPSRTADTASKSSVGLEKSQWCFKEPVRVLRWRLARSAKAGFRNIAFGSTTESDHPRRLLTYQLPKAK